MRSYSVTLVHKSWKDVVKHELAYINDSEGVNTDDIQYFSPLKSRNQQRVYLTVNLIKQLI